MNKARIKAWFKENVWDTGLLMAIIVCALISCVVWQGLKREMSRNSHGQGQATHDHRH
jgi:hypothetical protein